MQLNLRNHNIFQLIHFSDPFCTLLYCKIKSYYLYFAIPIEAIQFRQKRFVMVRKNIYANPSNTNLLHLHIHSYIYMYSQNVAFFSLDVFIARRRFQPTLLSETLQKLAWNLCRHKRLLVCTEYALGIAKSPVGHIIPAFLII